MVSLAPISAAILSPNKITEFLGEQNSRRPMATVIAIKKAPQRIVVPLD